MPPVTRTARLHGRALAALILLAAPVAGGAEENLEALYEISTAGSSTALKAGEPGRLVLSIQARGEAHVSEEAPLKVALGGKNVTWSKASLTRADLKPAPKSAAKPAADKPAPPAPPTFEVPFQTGPGAPVTAEATLTFFLCTKDLCVRQQRAVAVPVTVQAAKP